MLPKVYQNYSTVLISNYHKLPTVQSTVACDIGVLFYLLLHNTIRSSLCCQITSIMEATVICVDNSEWTRNSDYAPTRFQAQADCVNLLAGAKTQANAENTVGVLTMAGKSPRVLVTPTPDLGKILNAMQDLDIEGASDLPSSVQIAQLALKHRQNKNQRQRAVIFVGSPIKEDKVS